MTVTTNKTFRSTVFNLPNQLTIARLFLSLVLFGLIALELYAIATVTFVVAASTDWLDGYFARKYQLVTTLGRILDPFVDKVIVCGTFIFLVAIPRSGVAAWMAVVIVGRELLITALRSYLEQQGADFSAQMSGKLKMVLQCIAAGTSLGYLALLPQGLDRGLLSALELVLLASIWAAVAMTILSGVAYVRTAIALLRS